MAQHTTLNWRAALWPLLLVVGLGAAVSAHAERVITSSDSGNGGGLGSAGGNRLFNCTAGNLSPDPDVPVSCIGALSQAYNAGTDFGTVEGLVNGRFSSWTFTDQSSAVAFISNGGGKLFFNTELHGNFAFVLSGTWLNPGQLTNQPQRSAWSAYYLLEDIGILPQTNLNPTRALRLNMDGVDPGPSYYTTNDLLIDSVSVYQINAVPEPQSWALVGLGLAGLLITTGRRRWR